MLFALSALGTGSQDYGLPFHLLLSEYMFDLLALGVLNLRKFFSGGEFTRAIFSRSLYSEEKAAHMVLTFQL